MHDFVSLLRSKDVLLRGTKSFFKQMASESPNEKVGMDTFKSMLNPQSWGKLSQLVGYRGDDKIHKLISWVVDRCMVSSLKKIMYVQMIVGDHGFESLTREPRVFVGTMHSFKGSEADHVIIFPDLSPAGMREWKRQDKKRNGVARTFYVGMTRARKSLTLCSTESGCSVNMSSVFSEFI